MNYKDKYMGNGYDLQLFAQPNTQTTDASTPPDRLMKVMWQPVSFFSSTAILNRMAARAG